MEGALVRRVGAYEFTRRLGKGMQGSVYEGKRVADGSPVAIKFVKMGALSEHEYAKLGREVDILLRLRGHPYILTPVDSVTEVEKPKKRDPTTTTHCAMFVMELADGGELFDYLVAGGFPENIARFYFAQMMEAIHFAHGKDVVHRDLKPENLLVDKSYTLRVVDWGLANILTELNRGFLRTSCGTRSYMAPEVIRRELYDGRKVDVWSAAVILFIMVAGFPPFAQASTGDWWFDRLRERNYALFWAAHERSARFSPDLKNLINAMFSESADDRLTVDDVMKTAWYRAESCTVEAAQAFMRGRLVDIRRRQGRPAPAADVALEAVVRGGALDSLPGLRPDGVAVSYGLDKVEAAPELVKLAPLAPASTLAGARAEALARDSRLPTATVFFPYSPSPTELAGALKQVLETRMAATVEVDVAAGIKLNVTVPRPAEVVAGAAHFTLRVLHVPADVVAAFDETAGQVCDCVTLADGATDTFVQSMFWDAARMVKDVQLATAMADASTVPLLPLCV